MAVLEIRSLTRRYGNVEAVRDVSLGVEAGQVYGLLGPNGSGKTTTLACAMGLLRPTRGEVRVLGKPAARIHETRGRVGAVFDTACLLPRLSVLANLEYGRRLLGHGGGRTPAEALELVAIAPLARRQVAKLSLGQKKRVAVARALLGEPELLILDEPLAALDTLGTRALLRLITRLAGEGLTLVLSSHRLHEMETVITHAGILLGGRLVRNGTLDELLAGQRGRFRLTLSPVEQAERVLAELTGVECLERTSAGAETELHVRLDGHDAGALNRALVEAGCTVSALVPERSDLQTLFESLVDAAGVETQP